MNEFKLIDLTKERIERSETSTDWTPRDVVVETLRRIDSGEDNPYALMVLFAEKTDDEGGSKTHFLNSSPDGLTSLGLLLRVSNLLNAN